MPHKAGTRTRMHLHTHARTHARTHAHTHTHNSWWLVIDLVTIKEYHPRLRIVYVSDIWRVVDLELQLQVEVSYRQLLFADTRSYTTETPVLSMFNLKCYQSMLRTYLRGHLL